MAAKAAKVTTTTKVEPVEGLEITDTEDLDGELIEEEDIVEEAPAPKKARKPATAKKAKKEKPERTGMTTAEAAARLSEMTERDITPVALRRILRSDDGGFNDKGYTRYDLQEADLERLAEMIKAGGETTRKRGRKAKVSEEAEAPEELEALDDMDEEPTDEDIEELEEEDEEDLEEDEEDLE